MKKVLCLIFVVLMIVSVGTLTAFADDPSATLYYYAPSTYTVYIPTDFTVGSPLSITGENLNLADGTHVEVYVYNMDVDSVILTHTSDSTKTVRATLYNNLGEQLRNESVVCSFSEDDEGESFPMYANVDYSEDYKAGEYTGIVNFGICLR